MIPSQCTALNSVRKIMMNLHHLRNIRDLAKSLVTTNMKKTMT
jgi:hypothetical protein